MVHLGKKHCKDIPQEIYPPLFVSCYISGYFGSRLLSIVIEEAPQSETAVNLGFYLSRLFSWGPMTFYGGALAAAFVGVAYLKFKSLPIAPLLDIIVPSGFLALAIGRIGCFLNGDDYGIPVRIPEGGVAPFWSVRFPNLGDNIYRWPVQLIETGCVLLGILGLMIYFKLLQKTFRPGIVAYLMTVLYANIRLFDEFLRDDFRGSVLTAWLSTSQFISIVILVFCLAISPMILATSRSNRTN